LRLLFSHDVAAANGSAALEVSSFIVNNLGAAGEG
jgi:hypothetical protein